MVVIYRKILALRRRTADSTYALLLLESLFVLLKRDTNAIMSPECLPKLCLPTRQGQAFPLIAGTAKPAYVVRLFRMARGGPPHLIRYGPRGGASKGLLRFQPQPDLPANQLQQLFERRIID